MVGGRRPSILDFRFSLSLIYSCDALKKRRTHADIVTKLSDRRALLNEELNRVGLGVGVLI